MIEIISATALSTVQDHGRSGSLRYGVGTAGAMDRLALAAGNLMLGNDEDAACLEIPVFPFQARFLEDCDFALTGADCTANLDGRALSPWWASRARAGQTLSLALPKSGSRAYLALGGGIDVPMVLGSRSTQLRGAFGGLDGRALRQTDRLPAVQAIANRALDFGIEPPSLALPRMIDGMVALRVIPASEYAAFSAQSQAAFWASAWKVTPQSDRYGFRLAGDPLVPMQPIETRSHGIVPGVIQVPHGGQPIIQMRDAQPSGGYPKFGSVIEADLWRLGQTPIGSRVRFIETSYEEALDALADNRRYLDEVQRLVGLRGLEHA
ncbi:biotin-dependent carboxyltransferase family protein [Halotalea alkalilenta]|uniref:Allophanate hydrolase n=1 Tax=Halotalea alkalilenta TaxID=376489 RepID=A0A172YFW9_9GAMM|nr:biotin-dependent carboxyltransferase family protein [Halotalea alkalilenta]ANF58171.1 allophanate hydrolase [Halotalea alkalilenta]